MSEQFSPEDQVEENMVLWNQSASSVSCLHMEPRLISDQQNVLPYGGVRLAVSFVLSGFLQGAHVEFWTPADQHLHLLGPQQLQKTQTETVRSTSELGPDPAGRQASGGVTFDPRP